MPSLKLRINLNSVLKLSLAVFLLSSGINLQAAFPEQSFTEQEQSSNSSNNDQEIDQKTAPPQEKTVPDPVETAKSKSPSDDRSIEVEKWDFGIVIDRSGPTKDWRLHPVVVIPNLAGVQYAWKLKTSSKLPVFVREEFTLPEPPSTWKLKEGETTSELKNGGEQCILESFQATDDGWIGHAWTASHGDPPGKYQIKIWLNGKLAHQFLFNVGESVKQEGEGRDW